MHLRTVGIVAALIVFFVAQRSLAKCEDLFFPLDTGMQNPDNYTDYFDRDSSLFMLLGLMNPGTTVKNVDSASWRIACGDLPQELVQPLRDVVGLDGTISQRAIRDIFEDHYLSTIAQRNHQTWIKPTLLEFSAATNFRDWSSRIVAFSDVKRKTRIIFQSPAGVLPVISVSQTLASTTGDASAEVLETEVAIQRNHSADWDFYPYNKQGELKTYSTFPSGQRPSPRICISCHYDEETRAINRFLIR